MRVLLVEDKADFAKNVESALRSLPNVEVVWAASRDSALIRLRDGHFDLVLSIAASQLQMECWTIIKNTAGAFFNMCAKHCPGCRFGS